MEPAVFPRMHVSPYGSELAATVNFYTAFFGQPAAKIKRGYAKYVLDKPSLIISVENLERVQSHFGHLGFQVETVAELDERLALARKAGLVSREEMGTSCCYAKQDKFWVNDPADVEWEVYYFHADAEVNDPRYQEEYDAASNRQCCIAPAAAQAAPAELLATAPMAFPLVAASTTAAIACSPDGGCCWIGSGLVWPNSQRGQCPKGIGAGSSRWPTAPISLEPVLFYCINLKFIYSR